MGLYCAPTGAVRSAVNPSITTSGERDNGQRSLILPPWLNSSRDTINYFSLQLTVLSLQSTVVSLQLTVVSLQSTVLSLQSAVTSRMIIA